MNRIHFRGHHAWLVGICLLVAAGGYLSSTVAGAEDQSNQTHRADPAQFERGVINADAVQQAREFKDFPLVWLGEEFEGFRLTDFLRIEREHQDAVYLIYGTCAPRSDTGEPSCVPPVAVVVSAPGTVPPPEEVAKEVAGSLHVERGVPSRTLSGSPFLWTGGVLTTLHANSEHLAAGLAKLSSVNHDAVGFDSVGPGESLVSIGQ